MLLLWTLACTAKDDGGQTITAPDDSGTVDTTDTSTTDTSTTDTGTPADGCRATPAAADRDRDVVVSLPYTANGRPADVWAVLTLTTAGDLEDDGVRLTMGRSYLGEVVFTPDASLALVPTEDGHVAVYDAALGNVVHEAYDGGFYAVRVVMDPSGETAWIIDGNWAKNGGGLWRVSIDCSSGELSNPERVLEAKLPADLIFLEEGVPEDGMVVLVAREIPGSTAGDDMARLYWSDPPTFFAGEDAFGDEDAIVPDATVAGEWLLISDNSGFSGIPNRIARVHLGPDDTVAESVEIEDPLSLVPFTDGTPRVLVASGFGDALYVLDAETGTTERVTANSVQLPGVMASVRRGTLTGLVLVPEVEGLRTITLGDTVIDGGVWSFGYGVEFLPGALGIAP